MTDELKDFSSLCIIKQASLSFMADLLKWAAEWCEENGYENPVMRNTPSGEYELLAKLPHYE